MGEFGDEFGVIVRKESIAKIDMIGGAEMLEDDSKKMAKQFKGSNNPFNLMSANSKRAGGSHKLNLNALPSGNMKRKGKGSGNPFSIKNGSKK